jgi:hypothetical protein
MTKQIIFTMAATGMLAFALQPASDPGVPTQMTVTVDAVYGKKIPDLKREDVMVFQGKDRLRVTEWTPLQGERAGLELFILIDDASAVGLGSQFDDLREFIGNQPFSTLIGIGYMHNGVAEIVQNLTEDHAKAARALRLPWGIGAVGVSPYLAVSDLVRKWPQSDVRREVLMISSGADPLGGFGAVNPYLDIAIEYAQLGGIIVYAIYSPQAGHGGHSFLLTNSGQNYLARLAEETGGESYMLGFSAAVSFAPYLQDVAESLRHQYLISFISKPFDKPTLTSVRFATEVADVQIIAASKVLVWPDTPTSGDAH